jgi:hypothetical protein
MTVTTAETLSVSGVILNTLAKNIESISGRMKVAAIRTDNLIVPGRHGRLHTTQKYYDEGQIVLPMWVVGTDDNGNVPTSRRAQFYANVDALSALFRPGQGLLEVLHTLPDGSTRRAWCEVTEVIDFSVMGGGMPLGKFSVAMRVPAVFWEDQTPTSLDMLMTQNGNITPFAGMTAPIEDGVFTITGPATNPRVEALYNGVPLTTPNWFQYSGTIPAGQTLKVDCANWVLTGGGGFVPNYANFSHAGASRWLIILPPPPSGVPGLKITATSTTGASKVNLTAKRKYLVG